MIYFEHYLRESGVDSVSSVMILLPPGAESTAADLSDEVRDLFPAAAVSVGPLSGPVPACDLLISVFMAPWRFPFHDVVYESLDQLSLLLALRGQARWIMLYGASWRSVEVVAAKALPALVRKRRTEARLIRLLERSPLLRRLLRPLYG
jgi:hypothetical protein